MAKDKAPLDYLIYTCTSTVTCFIVAKLIGLIFWSWWWILSPIWIGFLIIIACVTMGIIIETRDGNRN